MVVFTYHLGKVMRGGEVDDLMFDLLYYCAFLKVQTAKLALRRLKTLRHPNILRYIDALEVGIKEMFSLMTLSLDSHLMLQLHCTSTCSNKLKFKFYWYRKVFF